MSFFACGGKKNKNKKGKGPRDHSPSYGSKIEDTVGLVSEEKNRLEGQLQEEKDRAKNYQNEIGKLKKELEKFKQEATKTKETAQSLGSGTVEVEKARLTEDLQSAKKETETQRQKGEEKISSLSSEVDKLSEDLKRANKALETERNTGESKLNKLSEDLKQLQLEVDLEKNERIKAEDEKEKYKREKDAVENKLAHTVKELEIAKKESHIPRSPTRAPSEEWKAKIEAAESELQRERQQRLEKERENSRLASDKDSLENDMKSLQSKLDDIIADKEREFADINARKDEELENLKKNLEMNNKNDSKRLEDTVNDMKRKLKNVEEEKEKLLTRLSSQTAAQVLDNNPNVSDLSDPNRPQKLGEQMSQIYDDQWTDATEALEKMDKNEDEIVKTLLDFLIVVYTHCKEAAENQLSRLEEDLFLPPLDNAASNEIPDTNGTEPLKSPTSTRTSMSKIPRFTSHKGRPALPNISTEKKTVESDNHGNKEKDKYKRSLSQSKVKGEKLPEIPTEVRKGIKEYRKKVTKQVWPVIEKEIFSKLRRNDEFDDKAIDACKPYITKCVELCWLMRVQDPPVTLSWNVPDDKAFNTDVYRAYTKSGSHVEYVVWPTMYLHEDGPLLMKGVAQGIKQ